jgi:hypothetical protein
MTAASGQYYYYYYYYYYYDSYLGSDAPAWSVGQ